MNVATALTDSEKLSDIAYLYGAIDACVKSYYDRDKSGGDSIGSGLMIAIERLNDEIGRRAGAI